MSRSGFYPDEDDVQLDNYNEHKNFKMTELKEDFSAPVPTEQTLMTRIVHSFHRQNKQAAPGTLDGEAGFAQAGDTSQLHRKLKNRHIQMIAIGGAIGAGLFIGSGKALATGGPGAVILDFSLIGFMLFCTVNALGELATMYPVQGGLLTSEILMCRIFHDLLDKVYRSGVGFCDGLELCHGVDDRVPVRTCGCWIDGSILEFKYSQRRICHNLLAGGCRR